jgi:cytochrome P450
VDVAVTTPTFPLPGSSHRGPAPALVRLREEDGPVVRLDVPGGGHAWLVCGYREIRRVLEDPRFSRAASYAPGAPTFEGLFQAPPDMIVSLDPPDHTRLRSLAEQAFSADRIAGLRPRVRALVGDLLGAVAGGEGPVDLLGGFADPLAYGVIGELLGVPAADRTRFAAWIRALSQVGGPAAGAVAAREQLGGYMADLVVRALADHDAGRAAGTVLDALVAARDGADRLTFDELVGLGYTLLGAGADSSGAQLANSVVVLLADHRATWRRLGRRPKEVPAVVEELLRTVNLNADDTTGLPRIALTDVELGGATVPRGAAVFVALGSGNRDRAVFTAPDERRFDRLGVPHLAFGHGVHRCLGAALVRLEMGEALAALTRHHPEAALAVGEDRLEWLPGNVNHRLRELPVHLGRRA